MREFRRRIAEGSPKGRRKSFLADINARPPDEREIGNCRDRIATHSGRDGAGRKKKKKSPKKKAPNKKRETAACGSACLRAAAPPFSLLLWAAAPPLLFASPLALLSGGCAALPLPLLFASSAAAPPHTTPRSRGRLAPPPSLPSLFPLYQTINNPLTPSHVMNFFSFAFFLD